MRTKLYLLLFCSAFLGAACRRSPPAALPRLEVCGLISKEEITELQGSNIIDTKSSEQTQEGYRVSQCVYVAEDFSKSVSLAITQTDINKDGGRSPKDFWKRKFGPYHGANRAVEESGSERDATEEIERRKRMAPSWIEGLGDDAFWAAGAVLYVLKGDTFFRLNIGGADNDETKQRKSKVLAEKVIGRL